MTDRTLPVLGHFINGQHVASASGRSQPVFNPATGAASAEVALGSAAEVNAAVAAASAAAPAWADTAPLKRGRILSKFKELIELKILRHSFLNINGKIEHQFNHNE